MFMGCDASPNNPLISAHPTLWTPQFLKEKETTVAELAQHTTCSAPPSQLAATGQGRGRPRTSHAPAPQLVVAGGGARPRVAHGSPSGACPCTSHALLA
jgi:hypothetical protein